MKVATFFCSFKYIQMFPSMYGNQWKKAYMEASPNAPADMYQ